MDGLSSLKNSSIPVWKTYLYQLQLQAPSPKPIQCLKNVPNRPPYYGLEYHGMISRQESEQLLGNEDGNYLVRESNNPPSSCTLAIKFNNETKNYKVYYDGAFYVGEKRFDNINDLVHDGLISFYIEKHASNYIAMMAEESNYAESPYVASRTALLARQKREPGVSPGGGGASNGMSNAGGQISAQGGMLAHHHHPHSAAELVTGHLDRRISPPQSIHSSFQRHHQQQQQQQQQTVHPTQQPSANLVQQHSFSYHQNHQQQYPHNHHLQHQLSHQHHNHHHQHQQQSMGNSNGIHHTLTNSTLSSSSNHDTTTTTSGVSTLLSQMMMDKENRQGSFGTSTTSGVSTNNTNGSSSDSNSSRFANSLNVAKSNTIFDRFDIINSEKPHRFKSQNFKGPHWCDFCLNFMWGLVSQGVKCQDCGFQAHKKCSERTPPDCEPQMRFIKRIFGVDLTTLVKATNTIRPILVEKCVEEIERRKGAIETEGLYRVSGFSDAVEELKMAFDRGENINFDEFKYNDIHIICSLLKLFLRQLPIPLITFDVYNRLIETFNSAHLKPNLIESIKACIVELPPAHYLTLKYLMEHLVKVTNYSSKNQMTYENLAIVFGPTLMRSINPDPVLALKNTHKEQKVTELLIANYVSIFEK